MQFLALQFKAKILPVFVRALLFLLSYSYLAFAWGMVNSDHRRRQIREYQKFQVELFLLHLKGKGRIGALCFGRLRRLPDQTPSSQKLLLERLAGVIQQTEAGRHTP